MRLRALGPCRSPDHGEEAYNKTSRSEEQHQAASFRALCFTDVSDQVAWLNKADLGDPVTKASLAKALGAKAFEEGRDDEASRQYHLCIDAYDAMPRTASTINEKALAYYGIFQATGDRQTLDRCLDSFQQAVDLEPSDPILLTMPASPCWKGPWPTSLATTSTCAPSTSRAACPCSATSIATMRAALSSSSASRSTRHRPRPVLP